MALDLKAIRAAIGNQIRDSVTREVNVYGGYLTASPVPPAVLVQPDEEYVAYHDTFSARAMARVRFRLTILTPPGPGADGQLVLDEFLSAGANQPNSVLDAVLSDLSFGGVVANSHVVGVEWQGRITLGDVVDAQVQADAAAVILEVTTHREI